MFFSPSTRYFLRYAAIGAAAGVLRAQFRGSRSTRWVLGQATAGAAVTLLIAVLKGKKYPEKDPDTPESISARGVCGVCGHAQAFHERKEGATTQECSSCIWSLATKSVNYTALHNFEPAAPPLFLKRNPKSFAPCTNEFPQWVEVIPGKLRVRVFLHNIEYEEEKTPCWSFVTDGLLVWNQKEIIFTLRRDVSLRPEDYPRELLSLFEIILHYAERGQLVDLGQSTLFGEAGFHGHTDFRGVGYVEPQGFLGVETMGVPLLAAIMLKGDEAQIAWHLGLSRVTGLLGMKYRYYPYPTWSDLKREPVTSLRAMDKSLLGKMTRAYVRGSYYDEQNHIFLSVLPASRAGLEELLGQLPVTTPVALYTQPDSSANACLVWPSGQSQPFAITPPGSDGSLKTGAFLAFVPGRDTNEIRMMEDGFFVLLKNSDWQKIREALLSGTDLLVPRDGVSGASISLKWAKGEKYVSPVTGETYTAERWARYEPEKPAPLKERVAVSSSRIVLLTSERDLRARTTADDLASYSNEIEKAVDTFFFPLERRSSRQLAIQLELTAAGHLVQFVARPDLNTDVAEDLRQRLESLPAPKVGGSVKFDLILDIWSIATKQ